MALPRRDLEQRNNEPLGRATGRLPGTRVRFTTVTLAAVPFVHPIGGGLRAGERHLRSGACCWRSRKPAVPAGRRTWRRCRAGPGYLVGHRWVSRVRQHLQAPEDDGTKGWNWYTVIRPVRPARCTHRPEHHRRLPSPAPAQGVAGLPKFTGGASNRSMPPSQDGAPPPHQVGVGVGSLAEECDAKWHCSTMNSRSSPAAHWPRWRCPDVVAACRRVG